MCGYYGMGRAGWASMIRSATIALLALLQLTPWVEGTTIGVPTDNSKGPTVLYVPLLGVSVADNVPHQDLSPSVWHRIELSTLPEPHRLPPDTKAVFLSGTLVSSGGPPVYCSMIVTFRAPGSTLNGWDYQGAAVSSLPGGAFRQNVAFWVPVNGGAFEFFWFYYPDSCPYIINLSLQAYVR